MNNSVLGILAAMLVATSGVSLAAPAVSGVSAAGGTFADDAVVTVAGSGFGANALEYQWLGGSGGLIESGASGNTPSNTAGWLFNDGAGCNTTISTSQAHSGKNSLYCSLDGSRFNGAIRYGHSRDIGPNQDIFVSWWVRRTHSGDGQWKMFRVNYQNDITDDNPQMVLFNWYNSSQFFVRINFSASDPSSWIPPLPKEDNRWYRMDVRIHTSSVGSANGQYVISLHDPVSGSTIQSEAVTGMTYESTARFYRWFLWQNYVGNGITSQQVWLDDLFVQVGTQARVELCDKAQWQNCTFREIQAPSSWSDGSIALKLNKGGFKAGDTAYLYVVDGAGVVGSGIPITIGGTAAATPPAPKAPSSLHIN